MSPRKTSGSKAANGDRPSTDVRANVLPFEKDKIGIPFKALELEPVPLGATTVQVELAEVPCDKLRLDRDNPRISFKTQALGKSNPTHEELAELIWEDGDVKSLKRSIQATGGLLEAIIVQGSDGTVLEGNCRLVCYLRLANEFPEDERWKTIRSRILPAGVTRDQINILLGELHVAGKNEWSAFERAAHLYEMNQRGFDAGTLAETYRASKRDIVTKIRAYRMMAEKYVPSAKDAGLSPLDKWSYFEEFYKVCKPKAGTPEGEQLEDDFLRWMEQGKFSRGEQVRHLPAVLADPEARKALEAKTIDTAWEVVQTGSPELGSLLFRKIVAATEALTSAPLEEVLAVKGGDSARVERLRKHREAFDAFVEQSGVTL